MFKNIFCRKKKESKNLFFLFFFSFDQFFSRISLSFKRFHLKSKLGTKNFRRKTIDNGVV